MKKVYICSPYRPTGQNPEAERKRNVEKAQTACRLAIDVGSLGSDPTSIFPKIIQYEGETYIKNELLYKIYKELGFEFVKKNVDVNSSNNKMTMFLRGAPFVNYQKL